jgi:hypothetical protein
MLSWREQVAPDWAAALEPMAPTLAQLGTFLREENAAGRGYLPAPDRAPDPDRYPDVAADRETARYWLDRLLRVAALV